MRKKIFIVGIFYSLVFLYSNFCRSLSDCYPRSIFVPRQLSYYPILENALTFEQIAHTEDYNGIVSVKPLYTQSVGNKFQKYFNINHQSCMTVREDGAGNINPMWFQGISSDDTFYSSNLAFCPKRKTYGALFFLQYNFPCFLSLSINTALVTAKNAMNINETNIQNLGTIPGFETVTQSLMSQDRIYGKVCCAQYKTNLDDIQIKLLKNIYDEECLFWNIYGLLGIPTGSGSKSCCIFEPMVGSKHAQLGLGSYFSSEFYEYCSGNLSFLSEIKWRYGLSGTEKRLFDLTRNGQWSRYMLLVNSADTLKTFFASNALALNVKVIPRNSLDLYLALHANHNRWQFEFGYDFWYRSTEKICLKDCNVCDSSVPANVGVADLVGIAILAAESASTANISQSVQPGSNQIKSDASFIAITNNDLNLCSGAAPASISNSFYASIAHEFHCHHIVEIGFNAAYEIGSNINVPNNVYAWFNIDFEF